MKAELTESGTDLKAVWWNMNYLISKRITKPILSMKQDKNIVWTAYRQYCSQLTPNTLISQDKETVVINKWSQYLCSKYKEWITCIKSLLW